MKNLLFFSMLFCAQTVFAQKKVTLNEIEKNSVHFFIGFQKVHEQFNYIQAAQKFSTDKAGSLLQQVDLHRAIIPVNDDEQRVGEPASTTFLLKIYDLDTLTGSPGALIREPLTIKDGSKSMIKIDLKKYKVIIPGKTFFIGIEWLMNERNQRLMQGKINQLVQGKRFDLAILIYQPFIGMVKNNKTTSDAWVMTPEHKWKLYTHNMPYMTDLSISAHILIN